MSFHQARNAFDDALRTMQADPAICQSPYGQALIQLACAMIELTTAMETGFRESRDNLSTVEQNLKEYVASES